MSSLATEALDIDNSGYKSNFCQVSVRKTTIKMPVTKVNLSQMVDLAVGTPEVGVELM
jgi:hypothetical protein